MGSLATILSSLQKTTNRLVDNMATDAAFVLRRTLSSNNKGGKVGSFAATTQVAYSCFYQPLSEAAAQRRNLRATQDKAGVFYEFIFRSDVDVKATDRLQLVAARGVAQKELPIITVIDQIGIGRTVIVFEETPL